MIRIGTESWEYPLDYCNQKWRSNIDTWIHVSAKKEKISDFSTKQVQNGVFYTVA